MALAGIGKRPVDRRVVSGVAVQVGWGRLRSDANVAMVKPPEDGDGDELAFYS